MQVATAFTQDGFTRNVPVRTRLLAPHAGRLRDDGAEMSGLVRDGAAAVRLATDATGTCT